MPDERGEVRACTTGVHRVAVPGVVDPRPRDLIVEQVAGHVLDVREQVGDLVPDRVVHGIQRQAAVPDEHRGHTMDRLGVEGWIPEHLRIGVGVRVDEARCHERARCVEDRLAVRTQVRRDLDDAAVVHAHVGAIRRRTGAVDHVAAPDEHARVRSCRSLSCAVGGVVYTVEGVACGFRTNDSTSSTARVSVGSSSASTRP